MSNKKPVEKNKAVPQQTTKTFISRSQSSASWSSLHSNKAAPSIKTSALSAIEIYKPVYDHSRSISTSSFRQATHSYSFHKTNEYTKNSLPSRYSNAAASSTSPKWNTDQEPTTSTNRTWNPVPTRSVHAVQSSIHQFSPILSGSTTAGTVHKSSDTSSVPRYDLRNRGYVLIFHNLFKQDTTGLYRKGSEQDLKLIKNVFKKYRVKVADICEDYSVRQVKKKMSEISSKNFSDYSCLIIIIMSHGGSKEFIRAKDDMYNLESEIVDPVLANYSLKNKPKLFFVQACKGDATMESDFHRTATNKFDILKCYSTYEGTVALRSTQTGSFFIQWLFERLEKDTDMEIIDIMRLMRNDFTKEKLRQAPSETSTLKKHFYFSDLRKH